MAEPRLATALWVSAYRRRLDLAGIPAFVTRKGDDTAGAVLVKIARMDGTARVLCRRYDLMSDTRRWDVLREGAEAECDDAVAREARSDPDLWVIELEDRAGRDLLGEDGLV
ncbi:hypothetical protein ROJ8625_00814 [Roseivivax jejudonensis]|uniref:GTP-binding protein Era n=1 Tax=Roseivivax jejudonensis TaxID=1529041 RepID=A0A1X6YH34_9RHOB|nr:DUF1491 family protein [Roseivivax jejudonensis]SLN21501.1 hypothetical protein ROJ8625_00814 [Roseivivax jejudonensis]